MKVFHGSTVIVNAPLVGVGRRNLDFGKGFYVTDLKEQAISWASRPLNADKPQVLNVYEFDKEGVQKANFQYKQFMSYDVEWLEFVIASRKGLAVWQGFDVIGGGIANDRVFNTIELYSQGLITQDVALQRLQYEQLNNQICILNQKVVDNYLHFMESSIVNEEEKKNE
jgi:hypothetical protein